MTVKKKSRIQASEVEVGNRTLEGVLMDLAERSARAEERSARAEELAAEARQGAALALKTIAAVTQDLRAFTQEMRTIAQELRASNERSERRLDALEKAS